MDPVILVAVIGAGATVVAAAIGRVSVSGERSKERRATRIRRIAEWREGVSALRVAETQFGIAQPQMIGEWYEQKLTSPIRYEMVIPPVDLIDVTTRRWYGTLQHELSRRSRAKVTDLNSQPLASRKGVLPRILDNEINRLERKWKIV